METKKQTFREHKFTVIKGSTHPEYSYFTFEGEEKDFREQYWNIKSGEVVFDVGASYGAYTLAACAAGARVFSFEPEKTVYCDLEKNVQVNNWEERCTTERMGFWSSGTTVSMKDYAPHWPAQTITGDYTVKTMDQYVQYQNLDKLDWVKIDTEGAEEHVLQGAVDTIAKFKPNFIIECHTFLDAGIKDRCKALLEGYGYEFEEVDRPPCLMLLARTNK